MTITDVSYTLEVGRGRHEAPARILNWLEKNGRDRLGPFSENDLLDLCGASLGELLALLVLHESICVADVEGSWNQGLIEVANFGHPCNRERPESRSVVSDVTGNHLMPFGLTRELKILLDQLPGRFHGISATASEKHTIQVAWSQRSQLGGQLDGRGVQECPKRKEVEPDWACSYPACANSVRPCPTFVRKSPDSPSM